jgi:hypothetical protein
MRGAFYFPHATLLSYILMVHFCKITTNTFINQPVLIEYLFYLNLNGTSQSLATLTL